jgi:hypothetical protein
VKEEISRYINRAEHPLVEVSGGLDPSTLAMAVGAVRPGARSYGLIQLGIVGEQQQRRRRELVGIAGLGDFEFPSSAISPATRIIIAHRQGTVRIADRVLIMRNGKLNEEECPSGHARESGDT